MSIDGNFGEKKKEKTRKIVMSSNRNSFPLSFPQPATPRGYGDSQLGFDHRFISQDNRRIGEPTEYRSFEERVAVRPFPLPSISDPYSSTRIVIFNTNMGRGTIPMFPQYPHRRTPIHFQRQESTSMHSPTENDGSNLTKEEQEAVLKKLKKEIYNPTPKVLRRVSLYYRDLNKGTNSTELDKHRDEDGKSCAVCLEDFEAREEVMLTPCNHMFHEECIVPWVKNHGLCPVCRATLYDRRMDNGSAFSTNNSRNYNRNSNRGVVQRADHDNLFAGELISLIQAFDEAFPRGA